MIDVELSNAYGGVLEDGSGNAMEFRGAYSGVNEGSHIPNDYACFCGCGFFYQLHQFGDYGDGYSSGVYSFGS